MLSDGTTCSGDSLVFSPHNNNDNNYASVAGPTRSSSSSTINYIEYFKKSFISFIRHVHTIIIHNITYYNSNCVEKLNPKSHNACHPNSLSLNIFVQRQLPRFMYRAIPYIDIRLIYFPMEIPVKNILGQIMFIGNHIGIIYCFPLRWQNFPTGSQHQVQSQAQCRSHLYDLKMQYSWCSVRQTISD